MIKLRNTFFLYCPPLHCCGCIHGPFEEESAHRFRCPVSGWLPHQFSEKEWFTFQNYLVLLNSPGLWKSPRKIGLARIACGLSLFDWQQPTNDEFLAAENDRTKCDLIRDIIGNPFRPVTVDRSWLTPTVSALAQTIYDNRRFADMSILADALEEAGCTNEDILQHCRSGGEHVRACWVVDLLLAKE